MALGKKTEETMFNARMRNRLVAALIITSLSSGCTTLFVKHGEGVGTPFAGIGELPCVLFASLYTAPIGLLALPFIVIDVPLSLTADVLFLPFDLAADHKPPERKPCYGKDAPRAENLETPEKFKIGLGPVTIKEIRAGSAGLGASLS